jgi:hypothetical protein
MSKATERKTGRMTKTSKDFVEAAATIGVSGTQALRVARIKNPAQQKKNKPTVIVDNPTDGSPQGGSPNLDHVQAYNKSKALRNSIEERKKMALEFCDVTPEMVLGATAMRAFASIDGAFDEDGRFDIRLARQTGAIHLIKKLETTQYGLRAEFYSNESAQQQLASYMGMEFAPKDQKDDVESLKAGIEAIARGIARERKTEITHEIRVEAWERVAKWVKETKARYSASAIEEAGKQYGVTGGGGVGDHGGGYPRLAADTVGGEADISGGKDAGQ